MSDTGTVIAVVSTLISSIALVGVAVSLLLQVRQLRTAQLQAARTAQIEVVRLAFENPEVIVDPSDRTRAEPESFRKHVYLNLHTNYLLMSFAFGVATEASIRSVFAGLFTVDYRRDWWLMMRDTYTPNGRRERKFFAIVDDELRRATSRLGAEGQQTTS